MPTVDQYLRKIARSQPDTPFWLLELQSVARAEWERQLLPFVPDALSAEQVLDELAGLLAALPLDAEEGEERIDADD